MRKEYKIIGISIFKEQEKKLKYLHDDGINVSHEFRKFLNKLYELKVKENTENATNL